MYPCRDNFLEIDDCTDTDVYNLLGRGVPRSSAKTIRPGRPRKTFPSLTVRNGLLFSQMANHNEAQKYLGFNVLQISNEATVQRKIRALPFLSGELVDMP
jgi:hypothetical protein